MIQAQIYREWGVAIVKGRVPTGSVGVFGAGRFAAVRTRSQRNAATAYGAVTPSPRHTHETTILKFQVTCHRSWSVFNNPYKSMHSRVFLFIMVGG